MGLKKAIDTVAVGVIRIASGFVAFTLHCGLSGSASAGCAGT
ncbi:Uncharacterised protein [Mycobacteroides abscessus subsp. bolletii]|nr:Uncharacterised protein [Mycobacteroides abscessus subsp. bolletii]SKS03278.1 Uncharacterised protein [Mycobacteroides abscessus subsp. abscessus]SHW60172.1 Uncharacterised protein [Mycobacteroides abscessus subsp. bolletii]SHW87822.1 Uncharacterised protein [Mycobacteroides abscessus subsp. bolletii]SHX38553.1 Uncharacterised protein [Mycobacteroides abscessus subsp. bolletii]